MAEYLSTESSALPAVVRPRLRDRILEVLRPSGLTGAYWLVRFSSMRRDGWLRSVRRQQCIDATGRPVPWITYPAIDFLAPRLHRGLSVFEWGSGASTLWFAERVGRVDACEHDPGWHDRVSAQLPSTATLRLHRLDQGERYQSAMAETGQRYDIAVIDGRRRVACAARCLEHLGSGGVVLWDNTDRAEYLPGLELLKRNGFMRVDFWGMAPMLVEKSCTSLLFRPINCLGI